MANDSGKRLKFKGRSKGPPFVQLLHSVTDSPEFGDLSGNALKLLIELCRKYRPGQNGNLSIPWSQLKDRGWRSSGTVAKAKAELLERGWIIQTRQGGKHLCSLYAVTLWPIDECEGKHQEPATTTAPNLWRNPSRG